MPILAPMPKGRTAGMYSGRGSAHHLAADPPARRPKQFDERDSLKRAAALTRQIIGIDETAAATIPTERANDIEHKNTAMASRC